MEYYSQKWDDVENILPSLEIWYASVFALSAIFAILFCIFYLMCKTTKKIVEVQADRDFQVKPKVKRKTQV